MSDEEPGSKKTWLKKIKSLLSDEQNTQTPRDAILNVLNEYRLEDKITEDTESMMESVLELNETQVREIMIPRGQMILLQENWDLDKIISVIIESGHSRYPVFDEEHTKVIGILIAKDLLPLINPKNKIEHLFDLIRPATFVPESKPLDAMLREFKLNRNHMAMVIDEYGSISGLVTIEDVIEEIVGEIDDEHDHIPDAEVREIKENYFQVKALMQLEDFNHYFKTQLNEEIADTIGGYILHCLGHMPEIGESIEIDGWVISISKANQRRILLLNVEKQSQTQIV